MLVNVTIEFHKSWHNCKWTRTPVDIQTYLRRGMYRPLSAFRENAVTYILFSGVQQGPKDDIVQAVYGILVLIAYAQTHPLTPMMW